VVVVVGGGGGGWWWVVGTVRTGDEEGGEEQDDGPEITDLPQEDQVLVLDQAWCTQQEWRMRRLSPMDGWRKMEGFKGEGEGEEVPTAATMMMEASTTLGR
jgi:hypothetical protein